MGKTRIEWCDYTINPVKGKCPVACSYCYARRLYDRFKWDTTIRYDDMVWQIGPHIAKGSRVFVGSTMELFGPWVRDEWLETIFAYCRACPSVTFIFLTKQPSRLAKWAPFPDNCWVGASAWDTESLNDACHYLAMVEAKHRWLSIEPLLDRIKNTWFKVGGIQWLAIGQQTPVKDATKPKVEWLKEIVESAGQAGIPVFLKDNLKSLFETQNQPGGHCYPDWARSKYGEYLRQELPS